MYSFPSLATSDLIKNSISAQISLFSTALNSFFNASLQLSELNLQAARKLVEESASSIQQALQLKNPAETGSFLVEKSQEAVEKVRGYQQNIQNIVADNMADNQVDLEKILDAHADKAGDSTETADSGTANLSSGHIQHESEQRPSPLVEKLIASVANDTDNISHHKS